MNPQSVWTKKKKEKRKYI